jgi:hypothetical protein
MFGEGESGIGGNHELMRCKDEKHWQFALFRGQGKIWCYHSRELRTSDPQWINYSYDGRSENWAKICNITGENATWNKKCNVESSLFKENHDMEEKTNV